MSGTKNVKIKKKQILKLLLKLFGSLCLLFLIFLKLDFVLLLSSLRSADFYYLFLAMIGAFLFILTRVYKWYGLLSVSEQGLSFFRVFVSYCFGLGVGILTPGRVGEITRIHNLNIKEKVEAGGLFFLDKFIDLAVVFGMALCGMYFLFPERINGAMFTVFVLIIIVLFFFLRRIHYLFNNNKIEKIPFSDKFRELFKAISQVPRKKIIVNGLLTVLSYMICVCAEFFLLSAFTRTRLLDVLFIHPIVMLTNAIPVTIGGIGLREGTSVMLYTQKGIAPEHAFLGGFLIFAFNTFFYGMLGVIFFNFVKKEEVV